MRNKFINLRFSGKSKTLTITNNVTGEVVSFAATKTEISCLTHKRVANTSPAPAKNLSMEIINYINGYKKTRYTHVQRLAVVFKILRGLRLGRSFTTVNNRFKDRITPIIVEL